MVVVDGRGCVRTLELNDNAILGLQRTDRPPRTGIELRDFEVN